MEKINLKDIDLSEFELSKIQGTTSTVYKKDDICLKLIDKIPQEDKKTLLYKFLEMDGIKLDDVLLPKILIMKDGNLEGYMMDNFKNSINMLDYLASTRYINCKYILETVKKASLILREIHKKEIICLDLSFDNILIDNNGNIKYSDIDGCCYKDYDSNYISILLRNFLKIYRKDYGIGISENLDRISFMLSFYLVMYLREIQTLNRRKYNKLANHINTLNNTREFANILVDRSNPISNIPYLDELIDDKDDYVIDRFKQLSLKSKVKHLIY